MRKEEAAGIPQRKREPQAIRVIPRFVYNPEKAERGLKAMAEILAGAIRGTGRQGQAPDQHDE